MKFSLRSSPARFSHHRALFQMMFCHNTSCLDVFVQYCTLPAIRQDRFAAGQVSSTLFSKSGLIKLVKYRFMEPFNNAIGLRVLYFSKSVINLVKRQVKLVIMTFWFAAILGSSISQYSKQR